MEDLYLLSQKGIIIENPKHKIIYKDRKGNEFDNELLAYISDSEYAREDFYNYLMSKRNWFQRLFNLKPNMRFFDEIQFKSFKQTIK